MDVSRIKIEPAVFFWGRENIQTITCGADTAGSLAGKAFKVHASNGGKFVVWFKVGTSGSAPSVAGYTGVQVTLTEGATATAVATAVAAAIDALTGLSAVSADAVVTVTDDVFGAVDPAIDVDSLFTFAVTQAGVGGELGYTDGDTEFKPTIETKEITAHQSGNTPLAELITKVSIDKISLTLKEVDKTQLKKMFSAVGYNETPGAGTEVIGMGTKKIGGSLMSFAYPLVAHPKSKAYSDRTEDTYFPKAVPVPGSLKFSGTDERTLQVEFSIYPDSAIKEEFNLFIYGDWAQDFSA